MHDTADFRAVGLEKGAKLFGRNQIGQPTLGDITPFKGVRAQPIDDDDVFVKGIERRRDVRTDEACAARDHIHGRLLVCRPRK